jgi:transcriptional regulator GlxA family with amidase domain
MATTTPPPLKVLYAVHPSLDTLDLTGPLEILSHATHTSSSPPAKVFEHTITAVSEFTTTNQNLTIRRHLPISEAHAKLAEFDVLVIPGGGSPGVLEGRTEPLDLIKAFATLPKKQYGGVRTLMSVCTGSLFLAEAGVLGGKTATTHVNHLGKFREVFEGKGPTKVVEERFVVNKTDEERGLRIITAGGVSSGLDASLWLVGDVAGKQAMERVAQVVQYAYRVGVILEKEETVEDIRSPVKLGILHMARRIQHADQFAYMEEENMVQSDI